MIKDQHAFEGAARENVKMLLKELSSVLLSHNISESRNTEGSGLEKGIL
jgi:hypothetical protein